MSEPLSQHPRPDFSVLHVSDTHLLSGGKLLHGSIDTVSRIEQMFQRLRLSALDIRAVIFTGDLTETGDPQAYRELRDLVEPHAQALGAEVVWVMGNHDEREAYSEVLFGEAPSSEPRDRVYDIDGLRVISLDTSAPGYHHGHITSDQLSWLSGELATRSPRGTLIAMHHPPTPLLIELMGLIELDAQQEFWAAIAGSDVRGVLAGHLHYSTFTVKNGVPVSVAAATCYTIDIAPDPSLSLKGVDRAHSSSLVSIYESQLVFNSIALGDMTELFSHASDGLPAIREMDAQTRRELFSKKDSAYNREVDRNQSGE